MSYNLTDEQLFLCTNDTSNNVDGTVYFPDKRPFYIYVIYCPFWLTVGLVGNGISILASVQQAKKSQLYLLQCLIISSDFLICLTGYPYAAAASTQFTLGPNWLKRNVTWMTFCAHLAIPVSDMMVTTSIILILASVADRLQALKHPVLFNTIDHKRRAIRIGITAYVIGIGTSLHGITKFYLVYCPLTDHYEAATGTPCTAETIAEIVRTLVRTIGLVGVSILACMLGYAYAQRFKKHLMLTSRSNSTTKNESAVTSKVLVKLLAIQSCSLVVGTVPLLVWYAIQYVVPKGTLSEESLEVILFTEDCMNIICTSTNFVFYFLFSHRFRNAAQNAITCKTASVAPIVLRSGNNNLSTGNSQIRA